MDTENAHTHDVIVSIQNPYNYSEIPDIDEINKWCFSSIQHSLNDRKSLSKGYEFLIRIVDEFESAQLNQDYRQKKGPTNVLSFKNELPEYMAEITELHDNPHLGDLVICQPLVLREAQVQKKTVESHWTHLIVHGALHLLGFDHIKEKEAEAMESLEVKILDQLGVTNPYA